MPAKEKKAEENNGTLWFVLRDLKRPNAKQPAYVQLSDLNFEVFTPMREQLTIRGGERQSETDGSVHTGPAFRP